MHTHTHTLTEDIARDTDVIWIFPVDAMALCMSLYCFASICVYGMEVKISVQLVKEETSGASVINLSLSDSEAVGQKLAWR